MRDSARVTAFGVLGVLGAALGGVVYLGTRPGASSTQAAPTSSVPITPARPSPVASVQPTPPQFIASVELTGEEQLILERLNEVRANPPRFVPGWRTWLATMDAKSTGCTEPASMLDPLATYPPRQPLAPNQALTTAARGHARDLLARGFKGHINPDGVGPNQRVLAAGYPLPTGRPLVGTRAYGDTKDASNIESIAERDTTDPAPWAATTWTDAIDQLVIDACVPSRGHREHVLSLAPFGAAELEVGIAGVDDTATKDGATWKRMRVVIEIAMRGDDKVFVTGVAYRDADRNGRYDLGEGVADVPVAIAAASVTTRTGPGGGYALPVPRELAGDVVASDVKRAFTTQGQNVKLDFVLK